MLAMFILAVSALANGRAVRPAGSARQVPSPTLLKSKRPLGRAQLTHSASFWLSHQMRYEARRFILAIEEETLGTLNAAEATPLVHVLRGPFSTDGLQATLRRRLHEAPPRGGTQAVYGAEIASRHRPTVWAAFQLAVQEQLERERSGGTGDAAWRNALEWWLLREIRAAERSPDPAARNPSARSRKTWQRRGAQWQEPANKRPPRQKPQSFSKQQLLQEEAQQQEEAVRRPRDVVRPAQPRQPQAKGPNRKQPLGRKTVRMPRLASVPRLANDARACCIHACTRALACVPGRSDCRTRRWRAVLAGGSGDIAVAGAPLPVVLPSLWQPSTRC